RHQVDGASPHRSPHDPAEDGMTDAETDGLTLDRTYRDRNVRSGHVPGPGPGGQHRDTAPQRSTARAGDTDRRASLDIDVGRMVGDQIDPASLGHREQRTDEGPVVDLVIVLGEDSARDSGREAWFQIAQLASGQCLRPYSQRMLKRLQGTDIGQVS